MTSQRLTKSSTFRIKTQPNSTTIPTIPSTTQLLKQKSKYHRYDESLYHKTTFHLMPLKQNPQLFTKIQGITKTLLGKNIINSGVKNISGIITLRSATQDKIKQKSNIKGNSNNGNKKYISLPQSISIRAQLTKMAGLQKNIQNILEQQTVMLITAKKWLIFDMQAGITIKGFKHKKQHDVASLTKVLTFYTAYMIIKKYFLSIDRLQLLVDQNDQNIQGTKINIKKEQLITLQDMLYALMLQSANNAATVIANNLGSLVRKKREGKYFSCFDLPNESKQNNMQIFVQLMNKFAFELGLTSSTIVNAHGMRNNKSTAHNIAVLTAQCYKIPLFSKIVITKQYTLRSKYISNVGEQLTKQIVLVNTNKLLWLDSGCVGGKTGCNSVGGQSLVACYEGGIIVVLFGCARKEDKFSDCQKLISWLYKKLKET